jgi:hypothetical protein
MKLKGATGVAAFIIVLLLIGLGFYYVVSLKTSHTKPTDAQSNQTTAPNKVKVTVPPTTDVSKPVESVYNAYFDSSKAGKSDEALVAFKKSVSSDLASKLDQKSARKLILCSDNLPVKLAFAHPPLMGPRAVIIITATFAKEKKYINVTSDVNTKKILGIDCH